MRVSFGLKTQKGKCRMMEHSASSQRSGVDHESLDGVTDLLMLRSALETIERAASCAP